MPESTRQTPATGAPTPYLEQLAQLATPVPNFAATLTTQAEQDAEDDNLSFLRTELPAEHDPPNRTQDYANESRQRMRRAVDAMVDHRVYTPAQLEELGGLHQSSYADRISRQIYPLEYHGWAPGASDDQGQARRERRYAPRSSGALLDEHVLRRDEHLRDRMRLRRLRDATQLEWRDPEATEPTTQLSSPRDPPYFFENGPGGPTEFSLRTTALLQAVRRNPQFSTRSRNELQRYILDRERGDDRDRTSSARTNEPSGSALSPSQRRQLHREDTVRQEIQQHRDLIAEHQQHRNNVEDQLRQQRQATVPSSESRRRRYWQAPSPCPGSDSNPIVDAIKYLDCLRLCESDQEGLETAEEGGFDPEECCPQNHQDFLVNTYLIPPPPESSWLKVGGVFSGTQHGASPATLPSYTPLMPPSTYRTRASVGSPRFGSHPPPATSVARNNVTYFVPSNPEQPPALEEERWPVKVILHSIDHSNMTLSGTMEAFNVPDKSSPTKTSSITTFLEGEIVDFNTFTLETKSFKAGTRVDSMYWRKLPPFKDLGDEDSMVRNLLSQEWLRKELMEKWILMRWKEKCFVTPSDPETALTISGFYYVSLRRADGHVEGLYYDPHSNPYQHLSLMPEKRTFPAYTFA